MLRILAPGLLEKKVGKTPPKIYEETKEKIASETRLLELRCSLQNRGPTELEIQAIVDLKLQLDDILMDWMEDKIA